jgi:acetyl esterase/lipase
MSSYGHLSDPDPEFAAHLEQHPHSPLSPPDDIATAQREWIEQRQPGYTAIEKGRLRADAKYRVQDYTVPVEGGEITVRAVIPDTGNDGLSYPLLFWMHGGGLIFGDVDLDDYFMRNLSTELQVTTLNVDYRLAPGHLFPVQLNDSFLALKWAIANAESLAISPKEKGIILGGCSAGATLAAGLAIRVRDDPLFCGTPITGQYLACPLLVHIDAYSNFPNELLSMQQNKDAPGLNKALIVWTFSDGLPLPVA